MFIVQEENQSLMTDYTELVISGLKQKYDLISDQKTLAYLLEEFEPIDDEYIENMDADYELCAFDSVKEFIEDRIGKDFVVFNNINENAFCIHAVDDFISEFLKSKNAKISEKQIATREAYDIKVAA